MKTKETSVCRECGSNGKPSKGYMNSHNIRRNDSKEFETKLLDCIKCESCGHSWIPKTSPKQIYITVVTSGLTMLANKVARVLQPNEDIFDACSELAKEIADENNIHWSNVLVHYFNHYSDTTPAMALKVPYIKTPQTTRQQAIAWWKTINGTFKQRDLGLKYYPNRNGLTGREIEEIWLKETEHGKQVKVFNEFMKSNQKQYSQEEVDRLLDQQAARTTAQIIENKKKQFKTFDESLFKAYIDKFSKDDLKKASKILNDKILSDIFNVK